MNDIEHKLHVLSHISGLLNKANVTWAVGASLLLYLKGKTDLFHDIDLMILESDIETTKQILSKEGILLPAHPDRQYHTRHFLEYVIDGVDFDVMAGFVIVNDGQEYDCSLKESDITESISIHGQQIPLQSLDCWKYYYSLMGRNEKVKMIETEEI